MKKIGQLLFLLLLTLPLAGCLNNLSKENRLVDTPDNKTKNSNQQLNREIDAPSNININTNINTNTTVKKFYPDAGLAKSGQTTNQDSQNQSKKNFIITQELQVKFYLVDKYNPGTCYGLPGPVPAEAIAGMIGRNPELAELVRSKYNLTADLDVYNKIKQLNGIQLEKLAGGKYQFDFTDGQCCILKAYEGEVTIVGQTISDTITKQDSKQNPC
ncbi:MAG: hypothetical protein WC518_00655 [Patescibacteria group bacterium]